MTVQDDFHRLFYSSDGFWQGLKWFSWLTIKNPMDLWVYQEILVETKPELVIETGTFMGGSALYLATILSHLPQESLVISIDVETRSPLPKHPGLAYIPGRSSVDPEVIQTVAEKAEGKRTMVILDSDHSKDHVLAELDAYAPLVTPGQYLVVEDTNVNGHPAAPEHGPGPTEALEEWLPAHPEFTVDRARERLLLTLNPGGYLRRGGQ